MQSAEDVEIGTYLQLGDQLNIDSFMDMSELLLPAVYALLHYGKVVYIGQSKKPLGRIHNHKALWAKKKAPWLKGSSASIRGVLFDEFWVRPCRVEELDQIEGDMILKYKPRHNIQGGKYTTIPPEMQNIVARIVLSKGAVKATVKQVREETGSRIERRGF